MLFASQETYVLHIVRADTLKTVPSKLVGLRAHKRCYEDEYLLLMDNPTKGFFFVTPIT